jgi:ATP/maltotriose-dependent transcriptional regulator MalT
VPDLAAAGAAHYHGSAKPIAALDRVRPAIGERVAPLLGPPAPQSFDALVTALINELAEPGPDDVRLVLDDYHTIGAQPVHTSLEFLLEHRPPGLDLVLASRSDPAVIPAGGWPRPSGRSCPAWPAGRRPTS